MLAALHVEIVLRVIEGTIKGREKLQLHGGKPWPVNKRTRRDLFKKEESETWETSLRFEPILSCGVPYSTLHIRTLRELLGVCRSNYL